MELVEEDAVHLFEMKAKVLLLVTVKGPVMYIGNPPFADGVALKVDRCITKDVLFTSETLTSITIFAPFGSFGANWASFGAVVELAFMFASLTRIDVPSGNDPMKARAPSLPAKDCMKIDTLGKANGTPALYPLLSMTRTAPPSNDRFVIDTVIFGFAATIAVTLRLIIMLPCATTFTNTTSMQDMLIVALAGGIVELIRMQGMTANVCPTASRITTRAASIFFLIPIVGAQINEE